MKHNKTLSLLPALSSPALSSQKIVVLSKLFHDLSKTIHFLKKETYEESIYFLEYDIRYLNNAFIKADMIDSTSDIKDPSEIVNFILGCGTYLYDGSEEPRFRSFESKVSVLESFIATNLIGDVIVRVLNIMCQNSLPYTQVSGPESGTSSQVEETPPIIEELRLHSGIIEEIYDGIVKPVIAKSNMGARQKAFILDVVLVSNKKKKIDSRYLQRFTSSSLISYKNIAAVLYNLAVCTEGKNCFSGSKEYQIVCLNIMYERGDLDKYITECIDIQNQKVIE
jgi:hypothetical protein